MNHFDTTRNLYRNKVKPLLRYTRRRRIDILLDYVVGKTVLDLGCVEHEAAISQKPRWWLHGLIKERARNILGVDYDSEAVAALRSQGYDICNADVENLHLDGVGRKDGYEVVMAGELFEHLTNHRSFLEGVKRNLFRGGGASLSPACQMPIL